MKKTTLLLVAGTLALSSGFSQAAVILRVTEVMSGGDIADWFEVTNLGDTTADITNYRVDDNSFNINSSLGLSGITSIAAGESVIFIEGDNSSGDALANVASFKLSWGLSGSVQVGGYQGSGISFSGSGDGVTLYTETFANGGAEVPNIRVTFGTGTPGTSFIWTYDTGGNALTSAVLSTGTPGSNGLVGSPGAIPEPSSLLLGALGGLGMLRRRRA